MVGQRSDVITLMRIRQSPSWIDIISIPRDSLVDLPPCTGDHATDKTGEKDKLNSAFSYASVTDEKGEGAAQAGMSCAAQAITDASGIPIDGTIATTFDGAAAIIDSLDGADLPVGARPGRASVVVSMVTASARTLIRSNAHLRGDPSITLIHARYRAASRARRGGEDPLGDGRGA